MLSERIHRVDLQLWSDWCRSKHQVDVKVASQQCSRGKTHKAPAPKDSRVVIAELRSWYWV
jgi:hypothetical protein